jgi:hypothetical protein
MGCVSSEANNIQTVRKSTEKEKNLEWIEHLLIQCDDSCTMLTKEFWSDFISNFKHHHMNNNEML